MQRRRNVRDFQEAQASGREWRHGFLEQTCGTHLLSAVHHILGTSAANCSLVCSSHKAQLRAQSLYCNSSLDTTSWPNPLLLCITQSFSGAATKGWAWCRHLMQRWRNVLRLSGTSSFWQVGCLEFHKWIVGMDSLDKHVQHISFRQYITFCKHRQLKGWQPHVQLTVAKISISKCSLLCSGLRAQLTAQSLNCNSSLDHNSVTTPSASLHMTGFFCSCNEGMAWCNHDLMQRWRNVCGSQEAQVSGREWMLGIPQMNSGNGFLRQTCPTHLLSAVRHILGTSAAERLAATRPTHCCYKLNLNNCSLVCSSHIVQLTAQSLYYCNKSWRPQLRDQTLCSSA